MADGWVAARGQSVAAAACPLAGYQAWYNGTGPLCICVCVCLCAVLSDCSVAGWKDAQVYTRQGAAALRWEAEAAEWVVCLPQGKCICNVIVMECYLVIFLSERLGGYLNVKFILDCKSYFYATSVNVKLCKSIAPQKYISLRLWFWNHNKTFMNE